jgi:solute:Na+ symporter, SSS family
MPVFEPFINISDHLSFLDWLVFFGSFICCIAVTFYGQYRKRLLQPCNSNNQASVLEYLLMGRQLTLPLFVATLVTTWYGGIFGVTQIAYEQGIYNLFTQGIFWYLAYFVFAIYIVKRIRTYNAVTMSELIQKLFGHKAAKLSAVIIFLKTLPIAYAISIGILIQCLFPLSLTPAIGVGVIFIALYAVSGGLRTVVYSDVVLFVLMCLGVSLTLLFSIANFGGLEFLQQRLPSNYFKICGTKTLPNTLVWFFIAFSTTFLSPCFYQRCMAAVNDKVASRGIIIATIIWFLFDICTTFGAMYAKAVLPHADSTNAYLIYGIQLLPNGFKGLLLASFAAAIIGTLDSFLFIASNIIFYDLKLIKIKNLRLQHCFAIFITALLTFTMAQYFSGKIEDAWLFIKSYFTATLLIPLLFAYFAPGKINEKWFLANAVISCSAITLWSYLATGNPAQIDSFYIVV